MKRIHLKKTNDFMYSGQCTYLIMYDHSSGHKNRYHVFLLNCEDPLVIGRELKLSSARKLIAGYEKIAKENLNDYYGSREEAEFLLDEYMFSLDK